MAQTMTETRRHIWPAADRGGKHGQDPGLAKYRQWDRLRMQRHVRMTKGARGNER